MLLMFWGFKIRFKTRTSVLFNCPRCGADREGVLRQARRWLTVFYLPLIPLTRIGYHVKCGACQAPSAHGSSKCRRQQRCPSTS